ncbi:MAG TPA: alpha/beta hydrolase [Chitinophagaceae bacterium]|jgi:pimeloyl-ACP methyl ester carboxylesterase|nr:alpha/beta hydrolase [Chitinophagaceae bacterium]
MSQTIYCISGLGADEALFRNLALEGYALSCLPWPAFEPGNTLVQYAERLCAFIEGPAPILMGVSFGGMLAVEMAKQLDTTRTVLISSITTADHLPLYYQIAGALSLTSLVPDRLFNQPNGVLDYLFGVEGTEDQALLHHYLQATDPAYIKWALDAIIEWDNAIPPPGLIHIHGTNDRLIPYPPTVTHPVQEGGHFSVFNRGPEISALISEALGNID